MKNIKILKIEWQRLVSNEETCSRCESTEEELNQAIPSLKKSLASLGIEVVIEKEKLSREEFEEEPLHSNRIQIDGRSLEYWLGGETGQSSCCEICGSSNCRTVEIGKRVYEVIPKELIIKAGLRAASQLFGQGSNESCCKDESLCS